MIGEPPRRLELAFQLADRAAYSDVHVSDGGDPYYFIRNLSVARLTARVAKIRTYAAFVPITNEALNSMEPEALQQMLSQILRATISRTIYNNPNIIGPSGALPQ